MNKPECFVGGIIGKTVVQKIEWKWRCREDVENDIIRLKSHLSGNLPDFCCLGLTGVSESQQHLFFIWMVLSDAWDSFSFHRPAGEQQAAKRGQILVRALTSPA